MYFVQVTLFKEAASVNVFQLFIRHFADSNVLRNLAVL